MKYVDIELVKWDSDNFGFKVGKVNCESSISNEINLLDLVLTVSRIGKENGYRLLYLFFPNIVLLTDDVVLNFDIFLADRKTIYIKELDNNSDIDCDRISSYKFQKPDSQLLALAYESGKYSRFKIDKHFSDDVFKNMYDIWISRSVSKEIADDVLVYEEDGIIKGMLSYKVENTKCVIGLVAVNPIFQGKSIGSKLIKKLETILITHGIYLIEVATQMNNSFACNFYEKNDFKVKLITNIYHIWL